MIGMLTGRCLYIVGQIALARLLGPGAFGLYAIGWAIFRIVSRLAPLGLDQGILRYGSRYRNSDLPRLKGLFIRALGLALLSGSIIGGGLFLAAPWLAEQVYNKPELTSVIRWFSPAYFLIASLKVAVAATRVSQRMQYSVYAEHLAQPAANLFLILVFFLLGWGLSGAVAALAISVVISVTVAWYHVRGLFPEVFTRSVKAAPVPKQVFTFSLVASLAGVSTALNVSVDRLMIGYFKPAAEVGVYQAIAQSSILFATIIGAFGTIFSPMIADLHQRGLTEQLGELFKVSTKWGFYICLPLFLVMCLAPHEIILVLFGPEYESGSLPLVILAVGQLINVGSGSVGLVMVMTGNQKRWLLISSSALLLNVTLNWLLIPRLGLVGAALAAALSLSTLFGFGLFQVKRRLGIWPHDSRYWKGLLAALFTAAALVLVQWLNLDIAVLELALSLTISVGVFVSVLVVLGLDDEDKEFIESIWTRVRRPRP